MEALRRALQEPVLGRVLELQLPMCIAGRSAGRDLLDLLGTPLQCFGMDSCVANRHEHYQFLENTLMAGRIKVGTTERGFSHGKFTDRYGAECSIQDSSLATERCIWLGIDDPTVQVCIQGQGWVDVPLPEDTLVSGRMHLTQDHAKKLIPLLQRFVDTGSIGDPEDLS